MQCPNCASTLTFKCPVFDGPAKIVGEIYQCFLCQHWFAVDNTCRWSAIQVTNKEYTKNAN